MFWSNLNFFSGKIYCRGGWYCSRPYKSICRGGYSTNRPYKSICRDGMVGTAG